MWHFTFFAEVKLNFKWTSTLGFVISLVSCYGLSLYQGMLGHLAKKDRRLFDVFSLASVACVMVAVVIGLSPHLGIGAYLLALLAGALTVYFYAESANLQVEPEKLSWLYREQRKEW
jgi:hypothetical protein